MKKAKSYKILGDLDSVRSDRLINAFKISDRIIARSRTSDNYRSVEDESDLRTSLVYAYKRDFV